MKRFNLLLLIVCGVIFLASFAKKKTDHFTIAAICSNRPYALENEPRPLTQMEEQELEIAFSQPYCYHGWGGQVYVFFSEDGRYVIKFLKQRLFRPSWFLNHIPLPKFLHRFRDKRNWKRQDKFKRDFFSYKASFDQLHEESGLLYCHLNQTSHLKKSLEIIDRLGIHHFLNLDHFDFLVQRRAERVVDRLQRLQHDPDAIRKTFRAILQLTHSCIDKGFYNRDPFIPHNCGFVEDRAIQIDVGRFLAKGQLETPAELLRICTPFEQWLADQFPHLLPLYQEEVSRQ